VCGHRQAPLSKGKLDGYVIECPLHFATFDVGTGKHGGTTWDNMSHGQYVNDDTVDMHGILVGRWRPGMVLAIGRAGLFTSSDRGGHWASARPDPGARRIAGPFARLRAIRRRSGSPPAPPSRVTSARCSAARTAAPAGLASTWASSRRPTMFGLAFDERQPRRMFCATSGGEVFASEDGGESWTERPMPEGATQVYAMACA